MCKLLPPLYISFYGTTWLISVLSTLRGVRVGIKSDLEEFVEFLSNTELSLVPCIDQIFQFDKAAEALDYLRSGKAFGKVVVEF